MKENNNAVSVKEELIDILREHPEIMDDVKAKAAELLEEQQKKNKNA